MKTRTLILIHCLIAGTAFCAASQPQTLAVLDFQTPGDDTAHYGKEAAALLDAKLTESPDLILVERQELEKLLSEQQLGLSGDVTPGTAARVGQLTGAKVLVTGRIFASGDKYILVAKIIGTETGRVYATTATCPDVDHLDAAVGDIAPKIEDILARDSGTLVAPPDDPTAHLERLRKLVAGKKLQSVSIKITEGQIASITIDPAAETEMKLVLQQLGFKVIDTTRSAEVPDITVSGEAFSEYGGRTGSLVSARARVEIKAIENGSGKLLLADRQTDVAVDLAETVAGKTALQNASEKLLDRVVPILVKD